MAALVDELDDKLEPTTKPRHLSPSSSIDLLLPSHMQPHTRDSEVERLNALVSSMRKGDSELIREHNALVDEVERMNSLVSSMRKAAANQQANTELALAEAEAAAEARAAKAAARALEAEAAAHRDAEAQATAQAETADRIRAEAVTAAKTAAAEAAAREAEATSHLDPLLDALYCQLTADLYVDPVCTSDGHTYEREAIEQAWRVAREMHEQRASGHELNDDECAECCAASDAPGAPFEPRSPNTGAVVSDALVPNYLILRQIESALASGAIAADEAAEWHERRAAAIRRQRERDATSRPASAPAVMGGASGSFSSDSSTETRRPSTSSALAHGLQRVARSASFGTRRAAASAAYPLTKGKEVLSKVAARREERIERRRHEADEAASRRLLAHGNPRVSNIKQCPSCHIYLEKSGGCDHFTCRAGQGGCGHEFCWLCDAPYNGPRGIRAVGNSAHSRRCPHHA